MASLFIDIYKILAQFLGCAVERGKKKMPITEFWNAMLRCTVVKVPDGDKS